MTNYRVQFLDRSGVVIGEYSASAENLRGVLDLLVEMEWPTDAVALRVRDPAGLQIHYEAIGDRT